MQLIKQLENKTVISKSGKSRSRKIGLFFCPKCKQGVEKDFSNGNKVDTCGAKGCQKNRSFRHGYADKSIYRTWANMKKRCDNPNGADYKYYGAKGITYPDKWKTFKGFAEDMLLGWKEGLTIDRKKHTENYSKENCQWIPMNDNRIKDQIKTIAKFNADDSVLSVYASAADAVRAGECSSSTCITRVARGERKAYKGFRWGYV